MGAFEKLWPDVREQIYFQKILRNLVPILLDHPQFTLFHIRRFLTDDKFRQRMFEEVKNPDVKEFWDDYAQWSASKKERETDPLLNRVDKLRNNEFVPYIIGQKQGKVNIRQAIIDRKILLVYLPLNEPAFKEAARTIGIFLMMQVYGATFSFANMKRENRPGFTLLVDEFSKWASGSGEDFEELFTFGRKYGIKQVLCHQHLSQLDEENMGSLKHAVTGAHTIISLRTNRKDSSEMASLFSGYEYYDDDFDGYEEEYDFEEEPQRRPTIIYHNPIDQKGFREHRSPAVRQFYWEYVVKLQDMANAKVDKNARSPDDMYPKYYYHGTHGTRNTQYVPSDIDGFLKALNQFLYGAQNNPDTFWFHLKGCHPESCVKVALPKSGI